MNTAKRYPIVLKLPQSVAPLIVYGRHVVLVTAQNPWFPSPTPPLGTITVDIDALEAAEATARNRSKGSAAARNLKKKRVEDDLTELKGYVQSVVNQNPDKAVAIIESAGMSARQLKLRQ